MEKLQEEKTDTKGNNYGIQDYMSIGYIVLLILGVLNQTIYYGILGVNIFEYTSLLDVLLSPIAVLSSSWLIFTTIIVLIVLMIGYFKLMKLFYLKLAKKEKYQSGKKKEKLDKILAGFNKKYAIVPFLLLVVISMYVGFGFGSGFKTKDRIKTLNYKYSHQVTFKDGDKKEVNIIGKNSSYIFYVTKDDTNINIVPIESNIKLIKQIKDKDKEE